MNFRFSGREDHALMGPATVFFRAEIDERSRRDNVGRRCSCDRHQKQFEKLM